MKRHIFSLSVALLFAVSLNCPAFAGEAATVQGLIGLYKSGDYSGCLQYSEPLVKNDPSNAVVHYYRALAYAQAGYVDDAISSYDKVIQLNSQETLVRYAKRGKLCLEDYEKCSSEVTLDEFIRGKKGAAVTNSVRNNLETQKLEQLKRDINKGKEIEKERLNEFKKFSYNDDAMPSNDEIVAAMQVLQKAGFAPQMATNFSDISGLYTSSMPNSGNAMDNLMSLMSKYGNTSSSEKVDPRLLQTMMTSQMLGF